MKPGIKGNLTFPAFKNLMWQLMSKRTKLENLMHEHKLGDLSAMTLNEKTFESTGQTSNQLQLSTMLHSTKMMYILDQAMPSYCQGRPPGHLILLFFLIHGLFPLFSFLPMVCSPLFASLSYLSCHSFPFLSCLPS